MNAQDYHRQLVALIDAIPQIVSSEIFFREIDQNECYIKAMLVFSHGYQLHLAEYVTTGERIERLKYRYQLLTPNKQNLARWDNAPHHKSISTFPDHRHDAADKPAASRRMTPADVIAETLSLIESRPT